MAVNLREYVTQSGSHSMYRKYSDDLYLPIVSSGRPGRSQGGAQRTFAPPPPLLLERRQLIEMTNVV